MVALIALFTLFVVITSWMLYSSVIAEQKDKSVDLKSERDAQRAAMSAKRPRLSLPKPASRGFEEWLMNPSMPLRLVVKGLRQEHTENLHRWLNDEQSFFVTKERREKILNLFGHNGAGFPDLEAFLVSHGSKVRDLVSQKEATSEGWDILPPIEQTVKQKSWFSEVQSELDEAVCMDISKFQPLNEAQKAKAAAFNKRFGFQNLRFYATIEDIGVPKQVEMNADAKAAYEQLYQVGLAKKGQDIRIEDYLDTYSLKQLSDLAVTNNGIFNSKEDAINYLIQDVLSMEQIQKKINIKTIYQSIPIEQVVEDIDTEALVLYSNYYVTLTDLFISTYQNGMMAQLFKYDYEESNAKYKFDVKRNNSVCLNSCKKAKLMADKTYRYGELPDLPVHYGCTCVFSEHVKG